MNKNQFATWQGNDNILFQKMQEKPGYEISFLMNLSMVIRNILINVVIEKKIRLTKTQCITRNKRKIREIKPGTKRTLMARDINP